MAGKAGAARRGEARHGEAGNFQPKLRRFRSNKQQAAVTRQEQTNGSQKD